MSKQFTSSFSSRAAAYATSDNYTTCDSRRELLNSVNQSNVNHQIALEDEAYTTLLHAAIHFGDKFLCDRILSIKGINLEAQDSDGKTAGELARESEGGNKAAAALVAFLDGKDSSAQPKENAAKKSLVSKFFGWIGC